MVNRLSVTQIKLFKEHPIDYLLTYVEGLKETKLEKDDPRIFGRDFAEAMEKLIKKEDFEPVKPAEKLANVWVSANKGLLRDHEWVAEQKVEFEFEGLPPFIGYIDLMTLEGPSGRLDIRDFKTVSRNIVTGKSWGLSRADLLLDYQLNLYAHAIMEKVGRPSELMIGHEQVIKNKKYGDIVSFDFDSKIVKTTPENVDQVVGEVQKVATELVEVVDIYKKGGLQAVGRYYGTDNWRTLVSHTKFGRKNPFHRFYKGFLTLEQLKEIWDGDVKTVV